MSVELTKQMQSKTNRQSIAKKGRTLPKRAEHGQKSEFLLWPNCVNVQLNHINVA